MIEHIVAGELQRLNEEIRIARRIRDISEGDAEAAPPRVPGAPTAVLPRVRLHGAARDLLDSPQAFAAEGVSEGRDDAVADSVIICFERCEHKVGDRVGISLVDRSPRRSPISDGALECVANTPIRIVDAFEDRLIQGDDFPEEIGGQARAARQEVLRDALAKGVDLVGEVGRLIPRDEVAGNQPVNLAPDRSRQIAVGVSRRDLAPESTVQRFILRRRFDENLCELFCTQRRQPAV